LLYNLLFFGIRYQYVHIKRLDSCYIYFSRKLLLTNL
jgi:hypothetical protein